MNKANKLPGGQQDQGHEVVHHDQGEGYQQPKLFRSGSWEWLNSSGCQGGVPIGTKIPNSC